MFEHGETIHVCEVYLESLCDINFWTLPSHSNEPADHGCHTCVRDHDNGDIQQLTNILRGLEAPAVADACLGDDLCSDEVIFAGVFSASSSSGSPGFVLLHYHCLFHDVDHGPKGR